MAFWEDALEAAMDSGVYSEDPADVYDDDVCPHGFSFSEECEECDEDEDEDDDAPPLH